MLVLLYFHDLGYTPVEVASLFVFYEFFGVVTNLVGGWLAARMGLRVTLFVGLGSRWSPSSCWASRRRRRWWSRYVMGAQALSGIAKDLTKMSAKSAVKLVVPENDHSSLFRWVALLTGSKNALKGVGFFLGGLLLALVGFRPPSDHGRGGVRRPDLDLAAHAPAISGTSTRREVHADVLQEPRGERPCCRAFLPLRGPRRLVRRGIPFYLYAVLGWSSGRSGPSWRSG